MRLKPDPDNPFRAIGENGHVYPSMHGPGTHWAADEAWRILDHLKPGAIPDETRLLLAGMIAGTLMRVVRSRSAPRGADIALSP